MLSASAAVVAPLRPVLGVWLSLDWGPGWGTLSREGEFEAMAAGSRLAVASERDWPAGGLGRVKSVPLAADASAEGCTGSALIVFSASAGAGREGARGAKGGCREAEGTGRRGRGRGRGRGRSERCLERRRVVWGEGLVRGWERRRYVAEGGRGCALALAAVGACRGPLLVVATTGPVAAARSARQGSRWKAQSRSSRSWGSRGLVEGVRGGKGRWGAWICCLG